MDQSQKRFPGPAPAEDGPAGSAEAADLLARSRELALSVTRAMGAMLRIWPREVSLTEDFVLSHLQQAGPQRLTALAGAAGVTQPSMTGLIARLAGAGLVERRRHDGDGRVVLVAVTDAGVADLERRRSTTASTLAQGLSSLAPDELDALERAIPALLAVATQAEPGQPAER